MSFEPSFEEQALLAETLEHNATGLSVRELLLGAVTASAFAATVAGVWLLRPPHAFAVVPAIVCFVVLRPSHHASEPLRVQLSDLVARQMGKALKPERVLFTKDLPKTRSAKIMRRVIRATYLGREPGDLSSLENPSAVKAITEAS